MSTNAPPLPASRRPGFGPGMVVFLAAIAAALPAVRGGFLDGDDEQLVLNFVLVSRPSLAHAVELLKLGPHRYLYQPVPMLSFAAEFALIEAFGLSPLPDAPNSAAWLFHFDNILIHACTAVLVWWLIRRLHPEPLVGLLAGMLFALHPMGMEPTAWLCGRMIGLSTLFSLVALNLLVSWQERPRLGTALLVAAATVLGMASKVQVGLPLLMLLLPLVLGRRPSRGWWAVWGLCAITTAAFALLNLSLTRQTRLLEVAAESLRGPRAVRILVAVAWYFRQIVWPTGLAPFHPARATVAWTDADVLPAAVVVLLVLAVVIISLRWTRLGMVGLLWFAAAVGVTLPFLPSRNAMVAERYVYLANIGLYWAVAALVASLYRRLSARSPAGRWLLRTAGLLAGLTLTAMSWRTAGDYRDDIVRNTRVAEVYPDTPGSWWRLAWAYCNAGRYVEAIEVAQRDLARHPAETARFVYQVVGVSRLKLNQMDKAIEALRQSLEADPANARTHRFLADVYRKLGREQDAIAHYRRAVELSPAYEPALIGLAGLLHETGRSDEAAALYDRVLQDNPYHLAANLAMAEIEISRGQHAAACSRLERLLSYAPESWQAWANLGVCRTALNDRRSAAEAYRRALALNPRAEAAALNLAGLLVEAGRMPEAISVLETGLVATTDRAMLWAAHDLLVGGGQVVPAVRLWLHAMQHDPTAADLKAAHAWACFLAGRPDEARSSLDAAAPSAPDDPMVGACRVMLALAEGEPAPAVAWVNSAQAAPDAGRAVLLQRMRQALGLYGEAHPSEPWPYYLAGRIMLLQGEKETGEMLLKQFRDLCKEDPCRRQAESLGITP